MTAPAARTALGATISMGPHGGSLTALAEVLSITPNQISRETIPASTLSTSGGMEYIAAGLYDAGEIQVSMHYIAGSTTDDALIAAVTDGALRDFEIVVKAATGTEDLARSGYVTSYGPDGLEIDGKQTATVTIKLSGDVSQAATA